MGERVEVEREEQEGARESKRERKERWKYTVELREARNQKFFLSIQHHCRKCGGIFCGACSTKRFPLLDRGFSDPVRVCDKCYNVLTRNN